MHLFPIYLPFRKLLLIIKVRKRRFKRQLPRSFIWLSNRNEYKCKENGHKSYNGIRLDIFFVCVSLYLIPFQFEQTEMAIQKNTVRTVNDKKTQNNKSNVLFLSAKISNKIFQLRQRREKKSTNQDSVVKKFLYASSQWFQCNENQIVRVDTNYNMPNVYFIVQILGGGDWI